MTEKNKEDVVDKYTTIPLRESTKKLLDKSMVSKMTYDDWVNQKISES